MKQDKNTYAVFFKRDASILSLTDKQMKDRRSTQHYMDGHINKTVVHRNYHRWVHQPCELFNEFLITIRELVKTWKFCSDTYAQESKYHNSKTLVVKKFGE